MPLTIYYCSHTKEAFNSVFDELFSSAEILVVENGFNGSASSKWEITYNQLSRRELTPEKLRSRAGYDEAEFSDRAFYETLQERIFEPGGKTIFFEHSPLTRIDQKRWQDALRSFDFHGKLKSVVIRYRGILELIASDQRKRNLSLSKQLKELVSRYPDRTILMIIGSGHKRVLEKLMGDQLMFSSRDMVSPMVGDIRSDLTTMLELGEPVTEHQLLMAIAENFELEEVRKSKVLEHADFLKIRKKIEPLAQEELKEFVKRRLAMA
jgi:hypothetical protein